METVKGNFSPSLVKLNLSQVEFVKITGLDMKTVAKAFKKGASNFNVQSHSIIENAIQTLEKKSDTTTPKTYDKALEWIIEKYEKWPPEIQDSFYHFSRAFEGILNDAKIKME